MPWGNAAGSAEWAERLGRDDPQLTSLTVMPFRPFGDAEAVGVARALERNTRLRDWSASGRRLGAARPAWRTPRWLTKAAPQAARRSPPLPRCSAPTPRLRRSEWAMPAWEMRGSRCCCRGCCATARCARWMCAPAPLPAPPAAAERTAADLAQGAARDTSPTHPRTPRRRPAAGAWPGGGPLPRTARGLCGVGAHVAAAVAQRGGRRGAGGVGRRDGRRRCCPPMRTGGDCRRRARRRSRLARVAGSRAVRHLGGTSQPRTARRRLR